MKPVVTLLAAGLKVTVEITGCLHDTESGVAGFWRGLTRLPMVPAVKYGHLECFVLQHLRSNPQN